VAYETLLYCGDIYEDISSSVLLHLRISKDLESAWVRDPALQPKSFTAMTSDSEDHLRDISCESDPTEIATYSYSHPSEAGKGVVRT